MTDVIKERLKKVLAEQLGYRLDMSRVQENTSLYGKGLGLGSVDVVSLIVRLEEEFDIFFEAEEIAATVKTFGSVVEAIQQKLDRQDQ
jgi:acyl carrier protein